MVLLYVLCVVYLLLGVLMHYDMLRNDKINMLFNRSSLGQRIIATFYSILVGPAKFIKCFVIVLVTGEGKE